MKFVLETLADVPEPFHTEYDARGGKFYLKTEGDFAPLIEANTKLTEFRDNNRTLNTKVTELTTQLKSFEGIDPVKVREQATKIAELENAGVKGKDDISEKIKKAVADAVNPLQEKLTQREQSEQKAREDLARQGLENRLRDVGSKTGVDDRAMEDYINRGTRVFKLVDGKPAARQGDEPIFSKNRPAEELSMEEWATQLQTEAPFLFRPSRGGGGGGNGNGAPTFNGPRQVIGTDPIEFGKNLEKIATGEVVVQE